MTAVPEDDDLLAAELAFGLLDLSEADAAYRYIASDPVLRARLATWEALAASLLESGAVPPRPSLWRSVEASLAANDDDASPARDHAARWRAAAIALALIAMIFGGLALHTPVVPPEVAAVVRERPLVAVLHSDGGAAIVSVSFDRVDGRMTLATNALEATGRSAELWVIPAGGKPRSLGLIALDAPQWRPAPGPAAASMVAGSTLAVTIEPEGGSPTGQPTTTPILTGTLAAARPI